MFANAVKLFDVLGFQIRVDPSWLLIAALIVWSLSTGYFPQEVPGLTPLDSIALSIAAMIGLFAGLILHELSHSLVARRFGLGVGGITLFVFGGVAELEQEPESPVSEIWIALAGPAMSFALAAIAWILATAARSAGASDGIVAMLDYLWGINLILALFNVLPAFPLDGGRVLRAALWLWSDDVLSATRRASQVGSMFAYMLMAIGLLSLFRGGPAFASLWPVLIGLFLLGAAKGTYRQMEFKMALKGRTVGSLLTREAHTTGPGRTIQELVDDVMLRHGVSFVPVVERGRLLGYVDTAAIRGIDRDNWDTTRVGDVYIASSPECLVSEDDPVDSLLERLSRTGRRKFLVADGGRLTGVITLTDLSTYITLRSDLRSGAAPDLRNGSRNGSV